VNTAQTIPSSAHKEFRPDIEGLRAIAVLLVLLYHAGLSFGGGYVGVDVFFVVSGFLITSLLMRDLDSGGFSLREFWARRARRLLAASAAVVLTTVVASWFLLERFRLAGLAGDVLSVATFSANMRFIQTNGDYLSGLTLPSPLLHFWSLALEEQFYVVWPLLIALVSRLRSPRRALVLLSSTLLSASLVLSITLTPKSPAAAYFMLPTRAWELLAGALLALLSVHVLPSLRSMLGVLGVSAVLYTAWAFNEDTVFPGYMAAIPVAGTLALLAAGPSSVTGRLLSARPLQWVGKRSYALYLWHWPVLVLMETRYGSLTSSQAVTAILLSFLLADVSLRLIENPVRLSTYLSRSTTRSITLGLALSSVVFASGMVLRTAAPSVDGVVAVASPAPVSVPSPLPTADHQLTPDVDSVPSTLIEDSDTVDSVAPSTSSTLPRPARIDLGRVLVIGDSTLAPLRWFVGADASLTGVDWTLDAESCRRLYYKSCRGREERTPASAAKVLADRASTGDVFDTLVVMGGYHSTESSIGEEFDGLVRAARDAGISRIVVLNFRESLAFPLAGSGGTQSVYGVFNNVLREKVASGLYPDVTILDWNMYSAAATDWFRSDGIHVNLPGALALGEYISDSLATVANAPCRSIEVCDGPRTPEASQQVLNRYGMTYTDEHCYELGSARRPSCRRDKLA
jgi:peptidoglycan/LPS O-acetylase OafA/YrhL